MSRHKREMPSKEELESMSIVAAVKYYRVTKKTVINWRKQLNISIPAGRKAKHGMWKSKEWNSWSHMKQRCYNENDTKHADYGGRGIAVCDRWMDKDNGFYYFFLDMGFAPSKKHTIDRINVNGNYEPSNCKWSTPKEQSNNRRPRKLSAQRAKV